MRSVQSFVILLWAVSPLTVNAWSTTTTRSMFPCCPGGRSRRFVSRLDGGAVSSWRRTIFTSSPSLQQPTSTSTTTSTTSSSSTLLMAHSSNAQWWRNFVPRRKKLFRYPQSPSSLAESSSSSSSNNNNKNSEDDDTTAMMSGVEISPLIRAASKQLQRLSWFSWWSQMILTTISTTILLFAASVVRSSASRNAAGGTVTASPSFFLSGLAVILSAVSIVWTWGNGARLSKRLLRPTQLAAPQQHIQAAKLLRRAVQVQVSINLLGLLGTLLAAEEIVGSLAIKVLTTFGVGSNLYNAPLMGLQPLDILVVQANTNSLLAQFISLATSLLLTDQIRNLDPPSTLEKPRKR